MKPLKERIEEIKTNGYQLDFATVFNHAFENYKKIALYAGLVLFVFLIFMVFSAAIFMAAFFDIEKLTDYLKPENLNPENFSLNFMLLYIMALVLITALFAPFNAGFLKMADCAEKDMEFNVSTIFEYYKTPYFKEIFLSSFLITFVSSGFSILLDFYQTPILGSIISGILSFLTLLTIPLIVFGNLKSIDAIKSSILIVSKQPFIILALLIVSVIASMVGFIGFCLGVFFTIPFIYSMNYAIYNEIVGIDSESNLTEIDPNKIN